MAAVAGTCYKRLKFSLVKTIRNAHLYFIDLFTIWCSLFWGVVRFGFVSGRVERILRKHVSADVNNTVCKERIFTTRPTRSQRHRRPRYKMTCCFECQSWSLRAGWLAAWLAAGWLAGWLASWLACTDNKNQ